MSKQKLGIIFGGMSTEHDVSIMSATSIINNLNKKKYKIIPIYISKDGIWYECLNNNSILKKDLKKLGNVFKYLKTLDIAFPVLHGLYGEDGTIQGIFEILKIPYVGCRVLGSSMCMDKVYTKAILEKAKIEQVKYMYIRKNKNKYIYIDETFNEKTFEIEEIAEKVIEVLTLPVFIKPSNSGSSVGINKATNKEELIKYIDYASNYDNKIVVEEGIDARELECAIIGNEEVETSCIGEIIPAEEFYSFDAKYKNEESKIKIPANITEEEQQQIKKLAIKAYKALDCKGLSRIDFFIDKNTSKIYVNEINTLPGFTDISMYPMLWKNEGIECDVLLDKLIDLANRN